MLSFLPSFIKAPLSALLFALNTVFWCLLLYPLLLLKVLIPIRKVRRFFVHLMTRIGEIWIRFNSLNMAFTQKIEWDIQGLENLQSDKSYLISSNHQSWMDIVILQHVFNRRIPFLRFFLKQELIYVPLLGLAWWALDFPFMKRYSKEYLEKHPEKRGEDLATTRRSARKFMGRPVSILNFLEGTRYTAKKHSKQNSPFKNLLIPKTGGLAFVLEAMESQLHSFLDVTIYYPYGVVSLWEAFQGKMPKVMVRIKEHKIPDRFLGKSYLQDPQYRDDIQSWVRSLWQAKDEELSQLKSANKA